MAETPRNGRFSMPYEFMSIKMSIQAPNSNPYDQDATEKLKTSFREFQYVKYGHLGTRSPVVFII